MLYLIPYIYIYIYIYSLYALCGGDSLKPFFLGLLMEAEEVFAQHVPEEEKQEEEEIGLAGRLILVTDIIKQHYIHI